MSISLQNSKLKHSWEGVCGSVAFCSLPKETDIDECAEYGHTDLVRLLLSVDNILLSPSDCTVLNVFSSGAVWISAVSDGCKQAPRKGHGRCLAISPCDYTGILTRGCLSFQLLNLDEMSTDTNGVIHVLLLIFVRS